MSDEALGSEQNYLQLFSRYSLNIFSKNTSEMSCIFCYIVALLSIWEIKSADGAMELELNGVRTVMVHSDLVLVVVGATIQDAMMNHVSNVTVEVQWM